MNIQFDKPEFLIWRTPLLPFCTCSKLNYDILKEVYRQDIIQESLFLASPTMYQFLLRYLLDDVKDDKEKSKLEVTLSKYLLRMSFRCTPYGLFAGISLGSIAETTQVELKASREYLRVSRLDMDFLCTVSKNIELQTEIRKELKYFPNNTLYLVGNQLRYIEYTVKIKKREHFLTKINDSEYIKKVLEISSNGATPLEIATQLLDEDIDLADALDFVYSLIDNQVLLSQLEPAITGKEYTQQLIDQLKAYPASLFLALHLEEAYRNLLEKDKIFKNHSIDPYWQIAEGLKKFNTPFELGQLFQVDMMKPTAHSYLNQSVISKIHNCITLLTGLNDNTADHRNLTDFSKAFYERYEHQEVPLMEVMDSEMGLGYPILNTLSKDYSPLLDDLPNPEIIEVDSRYRQSSWDSFLFTKYTQTITDKKLQLDINEEDIQPFLKSNNKIANSLFTSGYILAASTEAIDKGDYKIFHAGTRGPSSATLLGRFCHLNEELTECVIKSLREEESAYPNAIFAEVVHINQARIGNISARPLLRQYEIPIITKPGVDMEHSIMLEDLVVSFLDNRLILKSKKLNKEVIPRLSTAHNYTLQSLPVYQFLCDLQFQNVQGSLVWNWGNLTNADFLPRVCIGNIILTEAKWILNKEEVSYLKKLSICDLKEKILDICRKRNIPLKIIIEEGDNQLPLDLANELCLKVFQSLLKPNSSFMIKECLINETNLWVKGPEGLFTHEFIIPLKISQHQATSSNLTLGLPPHSVPRKFKLGSEWMYVKLYCGIMTGDKLLVEVILPLTQSLLNKGIIDQWFFVRYQDPDNHLRIRFHGDGFFYQEVILKLNEIIEPYLQSNLISKMLIDTYTRELERYSPLNMQLSESLFFFDSIAVTNVIAMVSSQAGDETRWVVSILGIDTLLNDCSLPLEKRKNLFKKLEANFKDEFNSNTVEVKKVLAQKFRKNKQLIESVLAKDQTSKSQWSPFIAIFTNRSNQWQKDLNSIITNCNGVESAQLEDILTSYIHMFLNRLFRSRQRLHELVIYDFLYQYYSSKWIRIQKELGG